MTNDKEFIKRIVGNKRCKDGYFIIVSFPACKYKGIEILNHKDNIIARAFIEDMNLFKDYKPNVKYPLDELLHVKQVQLF